jgi:carbon monoxide dehydrogenase subunit G
MEVKLDKRYPVAASVDQAWAVLCDVRAVATCMPGAQITEQIDDTHYKGTVKTKIGPASMQFNGDIELLGLDPAARSLQMLGKGADRGGSSASMKLNAHIEPGETADVCVLVGQATVTVSGKLAQFGSRLLVPVSDAMLAQFADRFRAAAAAAPAPAAAAASAAAAACGVATDRTADSTAATAESIALPPAEGEGVSLQPTIPAVPAPAAAPAPQAAPPKPTELNALALMWTVFKAWLAGLFGRR